MKRTQAPDPIDALFDHLARHPDLLLDLAGGFRLLMVSDSGRIACSRPGDLTCGWQELAWASDLLPFLTAVARASEALHGSGCSAPQARLLRLGHLILGFEQSAPLLRKLHERAMAGERAA